MLSTPVPRHFVSLAASGAALLATTVAVALVFSSSAAAQVLTNERRPWVEDAFLYECGTEMVSIEGVLHEVVRDNGYHNTLIARGVDTEGAHWVIANVSNTSLGPDGQTGGYRIRWIRQGSEWTGDDWAMVGAPGQQPTGCR